MPPVSQTQSVLSRADHRSNLGAPCMKLNIIKKRVLWWSISGLVILVGIGAMALSWQQFGAPLRPGLDFAGGTRLQLTRTCALNDTCETSLDVADIRQVLADQGLESSNIQLLGEAGQTLSVRTKKSGCG